VKVLTLDSPHGPGARPVARSYTTLGWLDALKGIAILAVVFDHAFIVDDYLLWKHSYFAVSWFIFLAGVSNTLSAQRRDYRPPAGTMQLWERRLRTILVPYLWASVLAYAVLNRQHSSIVGLAREVVLFHALPPLYFVALLLQLLIAFPLLYWALYRAGWWGRIAALAGTLFCGAVLSHRIMFPWVLGAHYFLGASFLYLFVLGMIAAPLLTRERVSAWLWLLLSLPVLYWGEAVVDRTNGAVMTHPPSNVLVVYAVALLVFVYALLRSFPRAWPARLLEYFGRHSLDIFLYHYLFLIPFLRFRHEAWTDRLGFVQGQIVLVLAAMSLAIGASLIVGRLSARLGRLAQQSLRSLRKAIDSNSSLVGILSAIPAMPRGTRAPLPDQRASEPSAPPASPGAATRRTPHSSLQ
jgi:peptidoglycan/LPS O-acetylase OafA/YrhL